MRAAQRLKFKVVPVTDAKQVSSVVEKFRDKYGAGDVKKYYSKFDVAVVAPIVIWGDQNHRQSLAIDCRASV